MTYARQETLNYHGMFIDRLIETIAKFPTTAQNKLYLTRTASSYDPSTYGYAPDSVVAHLKTAKRVVTSRISDEEKKEQAIQAIHGTINQSIEKAVQDAGEYVVHRLMTRVRRSRNIDIHNMAPYRLGVLEFAPFYVDPDNNESVFRDNQYIQPIEGAWSDVVRTTLDDAVRKIGNEATINFDPYLTPGKVKREITGLDILVSEYKLDARETYALVDGIVREMYKQGYDELFAKTLREIDEGDAKNAVRAIGLVLEYGLNSGLSLRELHEIKQRMHDVNEWRGLILTDIGKLLLKDPEGWEYDSVIQASKQRGQQLIETPRAIHEAIEDAMKNVVEIDPQTKYERVPVPEFDRMPMVAPEIPQ